MHGFKVHFRSPVSTPVKMLSVRPFSIFPSHFLSLLQIGREGFWMNIEGKVWESKRINKLNFQYPSSLTQVIWKKRWEFRNPPVLAHSHGLQLPGPSLGVKNP